MADLPLAVAPHPVNDLKPDELQAMASAAYPILLRQLTGQGHQEPAEAIAFDHPGKRTSWGVQLRGGAQAQAAVIELEDSWEAINDWFLERDLTDGQPIVPPTRERVRAMTDYVARELGWHPQDSFGNLAPRGGEATVEKIAANAVMAGCRPEYMPVLIACVQAVAHPKFNLDSVQTSTHPTSPLPIVNGPVRDTIDLNRGYNHSGSRWRSTTALGRALRLVMANIGGTPGSINVHTQGHIARFEHCIAENEEENPWEPLHVELGHAADTSTVTVVPACTPALIDDNGGCQTGKDLLRAFAGSLAYVGNRNIHGEGQPLVIFGPQHARILANGGYSKADVKRFLWEKARTRVGDIPAGILPSFSTTVHKFYVGVDPDYGVPIAGKPDDIMIVVMGGTGTHSLSVQTRLASDTVTVAIKRKDGTVWKAPAAT